VFLFCSLRRLFLIFELDIWREKNSLFLTPFNRNFSFPFLGGFFSASLFLKSFYNSIKLNYSIRHSFFITLIKFSGFASSPSRCARIFILAGYQKKAMDESDATRGKVLFIKNGTKTSPRLKVELTQGMITSDGEVSTSLDNDKHGFQATNVWLIIRRHSVGKRKLRNTHVVKPGKFLDSRVRLNVTLQIKIVTFLYVVT
jgi:hypothetical protein